MEFQLSYFKSWKMMLWKCCTQYASKFGKLSSGQGWKRSVFISISKKGNPKESSKYHTIALISHASKVMLKILQDRLQQYVNCELPGCSSWFQKRQRNQRSNSQHPLDHGKSKRDPKKKHIYFCFIDSAKAFDCVDHNKLWEILTEMGIPGHLTCLLRNLYAG